MKVTMFLLEQMTAGAVTLTDIVYWCVIFPFMALRDYEMSFVSAYVLKYLMFLYFWPSSY